MWYLDDSEELYGPDDWEVPSQARWDQVLVFTENVAASSGFWDKHINCPF